MNPTFTGDFQLNRATTSRKETLYLSIECPPAPDEHTGNNHTVSIRYGTDWTVETPHDLEAERIGTALGGYCACIDLVDKTIPAIRANMHHIARRAHITMVKNRGGRIHILRDETTRDCCTGWPFDTVIEASWHLRSAQHIANYNGAPRWQVQKVKNALEQKITPNLDDYYDVAHRLADSKKVSHLWQAGIHPEGAAAWLGDI